MTLSLARIFGFRSPKMLICGLTLLLAGCDTVKSWTGDIVGEDHRPCPKVAIVADASHITMLSGDKDTVQSEAHMTDFASGCAYHGNQVEVTVQTTVTADHDPQLAETALSYPYFIALAGPDDTVSQKQIFSFTVPFEANAASASAVDETALTIPLKDAASDAGAYQILLGFQLSPEELDYNRAHKRTPAQK